MWPHELHFIFMGLIGAFLSVLKDMSSWRDLLLFRNQRRLVEGCIIGYIYWNLYSSYGFPDLIASMAVSYMGSDLFESILRAVLRKHGVGEN